MKNDFVSLSESMAGGGSHLTACGQDEVRQNDQLEGMDGGGSHLTACEEPDVRENHQKEEPHQEEIMMDLPWVDSSPEGFHPYETEPRQAWKVESESPVPVFLGDDQAAGSREQHEEDYKKKKKEAESIQNLKQLYESVEKALPTRTSQLDEEVPSQRKSPKRHHRCEWPNHHLELRRGQINMAHRTMGPNK